YIPYPLLSLLFPYTTLFRSISAKVFFNASTDILSASIFFASFCSSIYTLPPTAITTANNKTLITTIHFLFISLILSLTFLAGIVMSVFRSEEHTSELQSRFDLVCRLLLEKKKN